MSNNKYYSINVPNRQAGAAFEGKFNKDTQLPIGKVVEVFPALGNVLIPNYSLVWAKRGGTEAKPNGELTFLKWGDSKGEAVEIRYLKNSKSLDKSFQDLVQKLKPRDDAHQLYLVPGVNDFEIGKEDLFIEFLKHHTFNGDNESRDPENQHIIYSEHSGEETSKNSIATRKKIRDLEAIILDAEENKELTVLASIFGLETFRDDSVLFEQLMAIFEVKPMHKVPAGHVTFEKKLNDWKEQIEKVLTYAVENKFLKGKDDGEIIMIGDEGKEVPFVDERQEGDSTVNFIMSKILQVKYYDAYTKLEGIVSEAKVAQLN